MSRLRILRIGVASCIFILFFLVFFNPYNFFSYIGILVEGTQFTPTVINSFINRSIRAVIALAFIVGITFLFGRIYCSFLCPLGIFQDIVQKITGKRRFSRIKKINVLRYTILFFFTVPALAGFFILIHLLDPYAVFGRTITHLAGRGFTAAQNYVSSFTSSFQLYFLDFVQLPSVQYAILIITVLQISAIIYTSATRGRLYCNNICPVGTLLGLASRFSPFPLKILPDRCTRCGACEQICKAGCISVEDAFIDNELCVRCYDCVDACPEAAVAHVNLLSREEEHITQDASKRSFLGTLPGVLSAFFIAAALPVRFILKPIQAKKQRYVIVPPGGRSTYNFSSSCISCHLCVTICPTRILSPTLFGHGRGIMQPVIQYKNGFCQYNCNACSEVCPTDAIQFISPEKKKRTVIGKVEYITDRCIVYTDKTDCSACAEHCPTGAVTTIKEGSLQYPDIHNTLCIGCGACEHVCPVDPKAIYVTPLDVHTTISEVPETETEEIRSEDEEFPF